MLYLHDVWVNWFEGEENGYNICHFHEWRKEDGIELLDQVPLLKVSSALFEFIENNLSDVPQELMEEVYQKAFCRKNHERIQLEYCFVMSDGKGIMAIDTMGYQIPIRKSRLIPRQEQLVYDMIKNAPEKEYDVVAKADSKGYHILSPEPTTMQGLTRKERQLKQLLFMALDQLHTSKNTAEIRYWYTEWSPDKYSYIQHLDFEDAWHELFEETKSGWTGKHELLCERIIKGQPFFEKLWEIEVGDRPSML
ncbi:YjbA family protein [Bacillus massiliigorillae]|uniref:YjbA family protein n=1 Tax=Bacillus massiliigorillae TaxID=1243664 RepID=UPI00039DE225|nr:YjbA family protein [Bacillus massiliigorillae]